MCVWTISPLIKNRGWQTAAITKHREIHTCTTETRPNVEYKIIIVETNDGQQLAGGVLGLAATTMLTSKLNIHSFIYSFLVCTTSRWCLTVPNVDISLHGVDDSEPCQLLHSWRGYWISGPAGSGIRYHKGAGQGCTKQLRRLRPQCGPISHPPKPRTSLVLTTLWESARLQTSPPSWAALSLPVPLSADAEGSLGIKPRRDVNVAAHSGEILLDSLHPRSTIASCWSRPVLRGGSC